MTALKYAEGLLSPVTEEHKAEARIIISDLTALPIGRINMEAPPLSTGLKAEIESIAKRRAQGEPLQYILGKWEFMGLPFYTRSVLNPVLNIADQICFCYGRQTFFGFKLIILEHFVVVIIRCLIIFKAEESRSRPSCSRSVEFAGAVVAWHIRIIAIAVVQIRMIFC